MGTKTAKKYKKLVVRIEHDDCPEGPEQWGGWKVVPFSNRWRGHEGPAAYISHVNEFGEIVPANIGVARKIETGTAFILSLYEHSDVRWSLKGEGPQCRWDTSQIAGIMLWKDKPKDAGKDRAEREKHARAFLDEYNAWANGWVYYYSIEDEAGDMVDSCGGFYDAEHMFSEIRLCTVDAEEVEVAGECRDLASYHKVQ